MGLISKKVPGRSNPISDKKIKNTQGLSVSSLHFLPVSGWVFMFRVSNKGFQYPLFYALLYFHVIGHEVVQICRTFCHLQRASSEIKFLLRQRIIEWDPSTTLWEINDVVFLFCLEAADSNSDHQIAFLSTNIVSNWSYLDTITSHRTLPGLKRQKGA